MLADTHCRRRQRGGNMERTARPARGHVEDSQKYDQGWDCANSGSPLLSRWVTLESPRVFGDCKSLSASSWFLAQLQHSPSKSSYLDSTSSQWPEKVSVISYPEWERTALPVCMGSRPTNEMPASCLGFQPPPPPTHTPLVVRGNLSRILGN